MNQSTDKPPMLDEDEARLLATYRDGPRIWDAMTVFQVVMRLEDKGLITPAAHGTYTLTVAGRRALDDNANDDVLKGQ